MACYRASTVRSFRYQVPILVPARFVEDLSHNVPVEVVKRSPKNVGIVSEVPDPDIALSAQESPHTLAAAVGARAAGVVMVNVPRTAGSAGGVCPTDSAAAPLPFEQVEVGGFVEAVSAVAAYRLFPYSALALMLSGVLRATGRASPAAVRPEARFELRSAVLACESGDRASMLLAAVMMCWITCFFQVRRDLARQPWLTLLQLRWV